MTRLSFEQRVEEVRRERCERRELVRRRVEQVTPRRVSASLGARAERGGEAAVGSIQPSLVRRQRRAVQGAQRAAGDGDGARATRRRRNRRETAAAADRPFF